MLNCTCFNNGRLLLRNGLTGGDVHPGLENESLREQDLVKTVLFQYCIFHYTPLWRRQRNAEACKDINQLSTIKKH